jgi:hypothetical protein
VAFRKTSRNQMTELSEEAWTSTVTCVRGISAELADALHRYRSAHVRQFKKPPFCVIDSYSFGQLIFNAGQPHRSEQSQIFEPALLYGGDPKERHKTGFPLGLLIEGNAEVTEFVYGAGAPRGVPQALLQEGDFIGSFEFMDLISGSAPRAVPDWMMTAGASSIRCAFNTKNNSFPKHLAKKFVKEKINARAIKSANSFLEQLKKVDSIRTCFEKCKTKVIYFGTEWFPPLSNEQIDEDVRAARAALMDILVRRTWRASSRIRPSASRAAEFFFKIPEGSKLSRPELHERQRAINIFGSLYDLLTGRRPMFVAERLAEPFGEICKFLEGYNDDKDPFVLRPCYLKDSGSGTGFMPVDDIASALVEGSGAHHDALMASLNTIDHAARLVPKERPSTLHEFSQIIQALSVRLPPGKMDDKAKDARTWKLSQDPKEGVKSRNISEHEFFEPAGINLTKPSAEFFRTCIRFSLS